MKIFEPKYLIMGYKDDKITFHLEEGNRKTHIKNGKNYIGRERIKRMIKEVM
tara:strand:- start:617 stop:772 length:156 start_codon:yes stop_codon:yes gene_type:complete